LLYTRVLVLPWPMDSLDCLSVVAGFGSRLDRDVLDHVEISASTSVAIVHSYSVRIGAWYPLTLGAQEQGYVSSFDREKRAWISRTGAAIAHSQEHVRQLRKHLTSGAPSESRI
jgi:hypothetical protein